VVRAGAGALPSTTERLAAVDRVGDRRRVASAAASGLANRKP
jgi:hypothetical protein